MNEEMKETKKKGVVIISNGRVGNTLLLQLPLRIIYSSGTIRKGTAISAIFIQ